MVTVKPYQVFTLDELSRLITGYTSHEKFAASREISADLLQFRFELIQLAHPFIKQFELEDEAYYRSIIDDGFSLAAYDGVELVALALADIQPWNRTFWIHEFHVQAAYRGQGIGRLLMDELINSAQSANCRVLLLETQNTNVPAIRFYQRMGFQVEAIDLSLYTNQDFPDGEIALFMKRYIR